MSTLLETYEKIAAHQKSPPNVFIGTMLRLLSREIPCLQDWAKAELNTLILKPADYDSRSRWVSETVAVLLRQHLPSSKPLYQTLDSVSSEYGGLNAMAGRPAGGRPAARPGGMPVAGTQWSRQGIKAAPTGTQIVRKRVSFGNCTFCPCRGCRNEPDDQNCSVYGGTKPRTGSSEDNTGFIETMRGFLKATGNTYRSPPYLSAER